jgi:hypothetical protein
MRNSFFKWTTRFNTLRRLHLVCQNQSKLRARRNLLRKWRSAFRTVKAVEVLSHITVRSRQRAVLKQWTRAVVGDVSDFSRPIDVFATPVVQTLEAAFEATTHRDPTHLNIGVRPGMTLHEQMQAASRIQNRCSFFIALRAWRVWMHRLEVRKCENMWLKCQQQQLRWYVFLIF